MEFFMKLPRNKKEKVIFTVIISIISVNIIAPLITCLEVGFHLSVWVDTLKVMPFIWLVIVALVILTEKPANWLTSKHVHKDDSFNSSITIHIIYNVFLMSIFLTVIGTWIGTRHISMEPITTFFYKWPRNFAIAFFVEAYIAQPIAHFVMTKIHQSSENSSKTVSN